MTPAELQEFEVRARDRGVSRELLRFLCPKRAAARCVCGRHAVQALEDAQAEVAKPCPDCGRADGWTLEGPP